MRGGLAGGGRCEKRILAANTVIIPLVYPPLLDSSGGKASRGSSQSSRVGLTDSSILFVVGGLFGICPPDKMNDTTRGFNISSRFTAAQQTQWNLSCLLSVCLSASLEQGDFIQTCASLQSFN